VNLLLFIITIVISFTVVRVGAIAFELTGLDWSLSKFQALSCFTGTGFTTKESELIVGNPQRRQIASVLMVLGNVGIVTLIATFANSLNPTIVFPKLNMPFLDLIIPSVISPFVNLLVIILVLYYSYRFYIKSKYAKKFTDYLRRLMVKKEIINPVSFEDLLVSTGGLGISSVDITSNNPALNKSIRKLDFMHKDLAILAILRSGEILTNPSYDTKLLVGDKLICYGKLDNLKKEFGVAPVTQAGKNA